MRIVYFTPRRGTISIAASIGLAICYLAVNYCVDQTYTRKSLRFYLFSPPKVIRDMPVLDPYEQPRYFIVNSIEHRIRGVTYNSQAGKRELTDVIDKEIKSIGLHPIGSTTLLADTYLDRITDLAYLPPESPPTMMVRATLTSIAHDFTIVRVETVSPPQ